MSRFYKTNMQNKANNIEEVLKNHGKRKQPDDLMKQRAMKNVRAHWQTNLKIQHQKKQKQTLLFKIAASILLIFGVGLFYKFIDFNNTSAIFSSDQFAQGEILYSTDGQNWYQSNQNQIQQGIWLRTSENSYTNITLSDNSQLRINQNTTVKILSLNEIRILKGEIYHDSDNTNKTSRPLLIETALGNVQHIGTRYMVKISDTELQVSVRNGTVEINNDNIKRKIQSGRTMTVDNNGNQHESTITTYSPLWSWTQEAGEPFNSHGKSLNDFVNWFAHENGYTVNWNNLQGQTKRVLLTGNISNLTASQQIKTIFLSTKFDYQINQGILTVL